MSNRNAIWVIAGCVLALLIVHVTPEFAVANPERRGRLAVTNSVAKTSVKITSPGELNRYLAKSLVVTYSDDTKQALKLWSAASSSGQMAVA